MVYYVHNMKDKHTNEWVFCVPFCNYAYFISVFMIDLISRILIYLTRTSSRVSLQDNYDLRFARILSTLQDVLYNIRHARV